MNEPPEVLYAVRRTDGSDMGDFSFAVVGGPGDWSPAEDDAEWGDGPLEYDLVKMTVEVVARRSLPLCNEPGCDSTANYWGLCELRFRTLCVNYVAAADDSRSPQEVDDQWSDLWDDVVGVFERYGFTVDGGSCGPTDEHYAAVSSGTEPT